MASPFIHPTAEIDVGARLGDDVHVWHGAHVMADAVIGTGTMLGHGVFVGRGVSVGPGCRIQNHVSIFEGVSLEADVFVGPSAAFTNVKNPRASVSRRSELALTRVGRGATIGANATILPGVALGRYCFVAAGAVVTRDVPDFAVVVGTPARQQGWMSERGMRLDFDSQGVAACSESGTRYRLDGDRCVALDEGAWP